MSKGLENLNYLKEDLEKYPDSSLAYQIQQEELSIVEKELKALEIINKKEVNIFWIKIRFEQFDGFVAYNRTNNKKLTITEYNLLKEVLTDEK